MNNARSRVAFRTRFAAGRTSVKPAAATLPTDQAELAGRQAGFTIVETLIVLAVAGVMFISAVLLVVGQQNKVEFNQAIRDMQSSIQKTINEVSAGYYPNPGNLQCDGTVGSVNLTTGGTVGQGSNTGCIFLGKALQFGVSGTDPQAYVVHSIAGLQNNDGTLAGAKPRDVAPGNTTNNNGNIPNATETQTLHNGLTVASMTYTVGNNPPQQIGAVAFVSELGQYGGGQLLSGAQPVDLVPVQGTATGVPLSTNTPTVVDAINNNLKTSPVNPDGGVSICFVSGGTKQSGLIKIGSNNRTLSVSLVIKGSKDCT